MSAPTDLIVAKLSTLALIMPSVTRCATFVVLQVFDGHNGLAAAHRVSVLMEYHLKQALQQQKDWPEALVSAS